MGLYDDIIFLYELPEEFKEFQFEIFQTKDLECYMTEYVVDPEGHLIHMKYGYRDLTEEEKAEYKNSFTPIMTRDGTVEMEEMDYHGDIHCYAHRDGKALDLIVRFTHGTVESIKEYTVEMQQTRRYYI